MHRHLAHLEKVHRDLTKAMHRMEHDHKKEGSALGKGKLKEMKKEHHKEGREMHKLSRPMEHHKKEHHSMKRKDCY